MIHFNNECGGMSRFTDIQGFEIAGADRVFHPAKAEHFWQPGGGAWDECFVISSPEVKQPVAVRYCFRNFLLGKVKQPVAVRYCFRNFLLGNLGNAGGLPLFPFRTDNW